MHIADAVIDIVRMGYGPYISDRLKPLLYRRGIPKRMPRRYRFCHCLRGPSVSLEPIIKTIAAGGSNGPIVTDTH